MATIPDGSLLDVFIDWLAGFTRASDGWWIWLCLLQPYSCRQRHHGIDSLLLRLAGTCGSSYTLDGRVVPICETLANLISLPRSVVGLPRLQRNVPLPVFGYPRGVTRAD